MYVHGAFADADSWFGIPEHVENLNADLIPKRVELKHHDKPVQSLNIGSLNDYVRSIEGKLPDDETEQCVLVGHSLGGMAISAAAADPALKGRIKRLVYVAAVMPMAGQTAGALLPVLSKGQGAVLAEFHKLGLVGAIRAMTTLASRDMGKSW
ncbi:alpha/beta fold hydrolase [Roseovarius sp. M141]|uniref:alpha/beta fold hydrolase n=1 Tax=Roseovarius sp. M141 TaxID=2583806 RepID=UPI0020CCB969